MINHNRWIWIRIKEKSNQMFFNIMKWAKRIGEDKDDATEKMSWLGADPK